MTDPCDVLGRADTATLTAHRSDADAHGPPGSVKATRVLLTATQEALTTDRPDLAAALLDLVDADEGSGARWPREVRVARSLARHGVHLARGQWRPALERLQEALAVEAGRDPQTRATVLVHVGRLYVVQGWYAAARDTLTEAWQVLDALAAGPGDRREVLGLRGGAELALLTTALGSADPATALDWAGRAERTHVELGDPAGERRARLRGAVAASAAGDHEAAARVFEAAAAAAPTGSHEEGEVRLHIGVEAMHLDDPDAARVAFERALAVFIDEARDDRHAAGARLDLGHVEAVGGRFDAALVAYHDAAARFDRVGAPEWHARTALAIAHTVRRGGRPEDLDRALRYLLPAIVYLHAKRHQFRTAAERASWSDFLAEAFAEAFDLADLAGRSDLVAELVELRRSPGSYSAAADTRPWFATGSFGVEAPAPSHAETSDTDFALLPPPVLVMPDGSRVLGAAIAEAGRRYETVPFAADVVAVF